MANVRDIPRVLITMLKDENNNEGKISSLKEMSLRVQSRNGLFTPTPQMYGVIINSRNSWCDFADVKTEIELLLHHVAYGHFVEAEAMAQANHELLLKEDYAKDEAGRTLYGTAFRIALGAKDVSNGKFDEMAEMLEGYLKKLPNGEAKIQKQIAAQFPDGWEAEEAKRKEADSAALAQAFRMIDEARSEEEGKVAVDQFKAYLAEQKCKVYSTGFHFNDDLFSEALGLYKDNYEQFGGFDSQKNRLAAINVIGSIEGQFTACLAQAACDGFGTAAENKALLSRKKTLASPSNFPFFHPDLGSSHFVYSYYAGAGTALLATGMAGCGSFADRRCLSKIMSNKNNLLWENYTARATAQQRWVPNNVR